MNAPQQPRCALGQFIPTEMDTEDVKRRGWVELGHAVLSVDDPQFNYLEKQIINQIATKRYGKRVQRA